MDEHSALRALDQLIQLETEAVRIYDPALKIVTDSVIRTQLEELNARHAGHAEQLSRQVLKMANEMIAVHWGVITSAALRESLGDGASYLNYAQSMARMSFYETK